MVASKLLFGGPSRVGPRCRRGAESGDKAADLLASPCVLVMVDDGSNEEA